MSLMKKKKTFSFLKILLLACTSFQYSCVEMSSMHILLMLLPKYNGCLNEKAHV